MPNGKEGKSFYFIKNDVTQKDIDEFIKINLEFINTAYKKGEMSYHKYVDTDDS